MLISPPSLIRSVLHFFTFFVLRLVDVRRIPFMEAAGAWQLVLTQGRITSNPVTYSLSGIETSLPLGV